MKVPTASDTLNIEILALKKQQENELKVLKTQFNLAYESLRPINLIKSTIHEVVQSTELKNGLMNNVMSVAVGYLSKKVLVGSTHNPLKVIFGTLLQFAVSGLVSSNAEKLKSFASNLFQSFSKEEEN